MIFEKFNALDKSVFPFFVAALLLLLQLASGAFHAFGGGEFTEAFFSVPEVLIVALIFLIIVVYAVTADFIWAGYSSGLLVGYGDTIRHIYETYYYSGYHDVITLSEVATNALRAAVLAFVLSYIVYVLVQSATTESMEAGGDV